jgi:predicted RNase H-like nuclease (RuvC/YqgF family)
MKVTREYTRAGDLLVETSRGDTVTNNKEEQFKADWERSTSYPVETARDLIAELERQVTDFTEKDSALQKYLKKAEDSMSLKGVDKVFFDKFKTCMRAFQAEAEIDKLKDGVKNNEDMRGKVAEQLESIKKLFPEWFSQAAPVEEDLGPDQDA